jgi:hypothetical protein
VRVWELISPRIVDGNEFYKASRQRNSSIKNKHSGTSQMGSVPIIVHFKSVAMFAFQPNF